MSVFSDAGSGSHRSEIRVEKRQEEVTKTSAFAILRDIVELGPNLMRLFMVVGDCGSV